MKYYCIGQNLRSAADTLHIYQHATVHHTPHLWQDIAHAHARSNKKPIGTADACSGPCTASKAKVPECSPMSMDVSLSAHGFCRWKHVLLTRYTFVNTLRRITPLVFDWTSSMPMPDLTRKLPAQQMPVLASAQAPESKLVGRQLIVNVHPWQQEMSKASDRRDKFMARLSRRIMKSRNLLL